MNDQLFVGAAEVDITPPVGTAMSGGLEPRPSTGVKDPLRIKTIVAESGGVRIAVAAYDLCVLPREVGDRGVELAATRTGIAPGRIVWSATHTHTGPYTAKFFGGDAPGVVDHDWLATLPDKFAESVARADAAKAPARMSRLRSFCNGLSHNRRVLFKDGRAINTWNLGGAPDVQSIAACGPIDPEVGALAFDDEAGRLAAVIVHFTLHTNSDFGPEFFGDYPAVIARKLREQFGPDVVTLFLPGACADINPTRSCQEIGTTLAELITGALAGRKPMPAPVPVNALKREIDVDYRDFAGDQEARIAASGWSPEAQQVFRDEVARMREEGRTSARSVLQAWRIGDVAFASLPGEAFVDLGIRIKSESPFPWTYAVENGGDWLGYLVTEEAWAAGGYESLVSRVARPSVESVGQMTAGAVDLLRKLHDAKGTDK